MKPPDLTNYPEDIQASVTTIGQLRNICWRIKPWTDPRDRDRKLFTSMFGQGWGVDCDEVIPGVFVGDKASIENIEFLRRQNITHVLNVAEGKDEGWWLELYANCCSFQSSCDFCDTM